MKWSEEKLDRHKIDWLADTAVRALLYEVSLSPKPGLVDRYSNGAHQDMTFFTFIDSIVCLKTFFIRYIVAGLEHQGKLDKLLEKVRLIGKEAEQEMLVATKGINTHKGANFSFALILSASGYYMQENLLSNYTKDDTKAILQIVKRMTEALLEEDFSGLKDKKGLSHGEKLYLEKGILGIRGEAAKGYPAISELLLPFLRKSQEPLEISLLRGLILLMSKVEDSNLIYRGGINAWEKVKRESEQIVNECLNSNELVEHLIVYDQQLSEQHLSPGGSADLLALGIYFIFLEKKF